MAEFVRRDFTAHPLTDEERRAIAVIRSATGLHDMTDDEIAVGVDHFGWVAHEATLSAQEATDAFSAFARALAQ